MKMKTHIYDEEALEAVREAQRDGGSLHSALESFCYDRQLDYNFAWASDVIRRARKG